MRLRGVTIGILNMKVSRLAELSSSWKDGRHTLRVLGEAVMNAALFCTEIDYVFRSVVNEW